MANEITKAQNGGALTIRQLMSSESVTARFNQLLDKKAPKFISSVISVSNSPSLIGATPQTILSAAVIAATLDLPVVPALGESYIVPYNNKGVKEAQFQLGYKGLIELAQRSGLYKTINVSDVKEGELLEEDMLTGEIKFKKLEPKARVNAKTIGYVAYFKLLNGFEKMQYMSREEIDAHAKRFSQSYRNDKYGTSLWNTQFDTMASKTVLKLLLGKYGPKSVEMQMAQKFDQAVVKEDITNTTDFDEVDVEYVDNTEDEKPQPSESAVKAVEETAKKVSQAASLRKAMETASLDFK